MAGEIGKVYKIQFILIGECPESETIINITHQSHPDLMLKVKLYSFIFARTFKYSFNSPFIIDREGWIDRMQVYLSLSVHIIIESRRPLYPDAGSETDISVLEFIHKLRGRHRIITGNHKTGRLYGCSFMGRETQTDIQSVDYLNCMAEVKIQVLEIIKMN